METPKTDYRARAFPWQLLLSLTVGLLVSVGSSGMATAGVSDDLAEELRTFFDELDEQNAETQFAQYLSYARIGDEDALKALDEATTSDSANRQLAARFGNAVAGEDEAIGPLVSVILKASDVYEVLRTRATLLSDELEVRVIEAMLGEAEPVKRRSIFKYLAEQKGPLYDVLIEKFENEKRRDEATAAIRHSLAPHGLEQIAAYQTDEDEALAQKAQSIVVRASQVPGRRSEMIPHLKTGLESPHRSVVVRAATRLLDINDRSGASKLIGYLFDSEDNEFRTEVAEKMLVHGVSPESERLNSLRTKLKTKLKLASREVPEGVPEEERVDVNADNVEALVDQVFLLLVASGDSDAFDEAVERFEGTNFDRRLLATEAFGYADHEEARAVKLLGRALFEGREDMRLRAAKSLRRLASPKALQPLKRAVDKERSPKVKRVAIRAIGKIGTEDALNILRLNTGVQDAEIKRSIIKAVRDVGKSKGARALRVFQSARNLQVQWESYVAMLQLQPEDALERLEGKVRNPVDGFMDDLLSLPTDRIEKVMPILLTHPSKQVHEAAISTIRKMGDRGLEFARTTWADEQASSAARREAMLMLSEYRLEKDRSRFRSFATDNPKHSLAPRTAWTLVEYGGDQKEAFRTLFDNEESPVVAAIGAYGLASMSAD